MAGRQLLSDQLRAALADDGRTLYLIAAAAGVNRSVVARFRSGERTLTLDSLDRIAAALGLALAPAEGGPYRPSSKDEG